MRHRRLSKGRCQKAAELFQASLSAIACREVDEARTDRSYTRNVRDPPETVETQTGRLPTLVCTAAPFARYNKADQVPHVVGYRDKPLLFHSSGQRGARRSGPFHRGFCLEV